MKTSITLLACAILTACGSGTDTVTSSDTACRTRLGAEVGCTPRHVVKFGDSITVGEGTMLLDYLPPNSVVENHGRNGATAQHRIMWGVPAFQQGKTYVFSYGANECLQGKTVAEYSANLRALLAGAAGHKIILEAPWRLTNPQANCHLRIDSLRAAVVQLGAELNIPVAELDNDQTHDRGGIHLLEPHTRARVALVAAVVNRIN